MHPIDQARARYGVALVRDDLDRLVGQILGGKAVYVRHDGVCYIYIIKWCGVVMVAAYWPEQQIIKTFLPAESLTPKHMRAHHRVQRKRLRVQRGKGRWQAFRDAITGEPE